MLSLDEKITQLAEALDRAGIPYAFGGAIALAFYAAPRATENVDLNLFVPVERADEVASVLAQLGVAGHASARDLDRHQATLFWDHTPIHLFFAYDAFHESCRARVRRVPFGATTIRVLAAEDIVVFKVVYDRPKDRSEVREVLLCLGERFDAAYALGWLERILGPDDPRAAGFRAAVAERARAV